MVSSLKAAGLLLLVSSLSAVRADDVEDALDSARIKARAGKNEAALQIMEKLLDDHRADARVHFYRAVYLKNLKRQNEAADAVEAALARIEKSPHQTIRKPLEDLADDLLLYRRRVRKEVVTLRDDGIKACEKLFGSTEEVWACYIIEGLGGVTEGTDEILDKLNRRPAGSLRQQYQKLTRRSPSGGGVGSDKDRALLVKKNISLGEKQLRAKKYDEARVSAKAALEIEPANVTALIVLSEAYAGLKRKNEAVAAALKAIDAPKGEARSARTLYRRATKGLDKLVAELEAFVTDRERVAKDLLSIRKLAVRKKRTYDVEWIDTMPVRLAPGDPAVGAVLKGRGPPAGFRDLTAKGVTWKWTNKGPGSKRAANEIILTNAKPGGYMAEVACTPQMLAKQFVLRFELLYDLVEGKGHPLWIIFNGERQACALFCVPDRGHHVAFARLDQKGWATGSRHAFPQGKPVPGRWFPYEIRWDGAQKRLTMTVAGDKAYDSRLDAKDDLSGLLSFAFCGGKQICLRNVYLKNTE